MRYDTKKYTIARYEPGDEFDEETYEVNLKDGYVFSDGSHANYANSYEDLLELLAEIEEE